MSSDDIISLKQLLPPRAIQEDEIPRNGGRVPEYANTVLLCVDDFTGGLARGRIRSFCFPEILPFDSLDQMLFTLIDVVDETGVVQASARMRSLAPKSEGRGSQNRAYGTWLQQAEPRPMAPACQFREFYTAQGKLASFYLRLYSRSHASVQGVIARVGAGKPDKELVPFRSALELLTMIREILCAGTAAEETVTAAPAGKEGNMNERCFVKLINNETALYICASIGKYVGDRVELLENGALLALVNRPGGRIKVKKSSTTTGKTIRSSALVQYVAAYFRTKIIPAVYDTLTDTLYLGTDQDFFEEASADTEEAQGFKRNFRPVDPTQARQIDLLFHISMNGPRLMLKGRFPLCSRAEAAKDTLAFIPDKHGAVALERENGAAVVRNAEVVYFAKERWRGATLYRRTVDGAVVVSPNLVQLLRFQNLNAFLPLSKLSYSVLDMTRNFSLLFSKFAVKQLGARAAVYICGNWIGLCAQENGDVFIKRQAEGTGKAFCQRLYQQLTMRFPSNTRLYLHPYQNLMVVSNERELGGTLPPPDYFCRLLMEDQLTSNQELQAQVPERDGEERLSARS